MSTVLLLNMHLLKSVILVCFWSHKIIDVYHALKGGLFSQCLYVVRVSRSINSNNNNNIGKQETNHDDDDRKNVIIIVITTAK